MPKKVAFISYYTKTNKFSFNALVGALETEPSLDKITFWFANNEAELLTLVSNAVINFEKVILGISFFTTQIWEITPLIRRLKRTYKEKVFIICGGPHPTGDPKGTLKMGADVVVIGEGEVTLIELMKRMVNSKDILKIAGIAFEKHGNCISNQKRARIDLNLYPPFPLKNSRFGPIEISRGCPYVCYFCQTPFIFGSKPRHRTVGNICKYVEIMKHENLTDLRFITPNTFAYGSQDGKELNLEELETLLVRISNIIKPNGRIFLGSFPSEVRPEHVNDETLKLVLRYASNDNITIGAQSGSQAILDKCNRGHSIEDVVNAVELTLKYGIKANVDFIFGLPGETDQDIEKTLNLMTYISKLGARIHTHSFIPLPMTPFANESVTRVHNKYKNKIKQLTARGQAFGEWRKQERIAKKIAQYMKQTENCFKISKM